MFKWLLRIGIFSSTLTFAALAVIYYGFQASLPNLEGELETTGVSAPVSVERDKNGNATITAENRTDLAFVTGYIHAQERFFQMDLSRRMASGELSALFGDLAVETDKENRFHRFRHRARVAMDHISAEELDILNQYVAGVNAGLSSLGSKPFEYWLLNADPEPWTREDTFLAIYSMFFTLQSADGGFEWQNHLLKQSLSPEMVAFLLPDRTEWDAPLQEDAAPFQMTEIPDAPNYNIAFNQFERDDKPMLGSNNWAVTGNLTETGAAMLSNDMHLTIRAPSIWYKLRLKSNDGSLDITGVSLAGAPAIVVGSNGDVAWGFTNTNIDTSDLIELTINPENENQYLTKDGYKDFDRITESISVKGGTDDTLEVVETIWGPVIDKGTHGKYAYRWVAHMPDGVNMSLMQMEQVKSVEQAMSIAGEMGIPAQNAMIVDRDGNAGWTIFGRIANRPNGDYREIFNWSDGSRVWNDWYGSAEYPRVLNPENDRLWTANSRVVSGDDLIQVGTNRYDLGARQQQIRDRLNQLNSPVVEDDLYGIMLDNEAVFLSRWQEQLTGVLEKSGDAAFDAYLTGVNNWGGFADKNSVGFRLVKDYRDQVYENLFSRITAACVQFDEACEYDRATKQWEAPLWKLVSEMPAGWLPPEYQSWQFFFEKAAFDAWEDVIKGGTPLNEYTWGVRNTTSIKHPLSAAVPLLGNMIDMPAYAQNGDTENMPHIAGKTQGQSERIVVSPGYEENGYMDLPSGQSGHPLSPYYGAGHQDWLEGNKTPFLPGEAEWTLKFNPLPRH
ncbi:penicillin acylase family protein [Pseudemcibacter aquimaris]|uniref:penicillin acylase family protein n=1 Tax=Pseudemcibacter aquimaris TaxID=2857064 RepID=UPI0020131562|nr:penicillin acylase family protein [Pseudemcibacter aquimaris]MCC3861527.1 penicillin acylase family protein [Pseudemcibacter aquimaris]WDU58296.1 penicillin acylase family protein [Pseudemcibacter aquimaris]